MRQQRFDEAIALLNAWRGRKDQSDWLAYAQYNLGVALVRKGLVDRSRSVPHHRRHDGIRAAASCARLKDRANLALGYAYLQDNQPALAKPVLERVRLDGPFSNKALLGVGWADAAEGQFQEALTPWMELRDRNLLDSAVQEAYLAIPYAFAKLNANAQAAENYELAITFVRHRDREPRCVHRRDQRRHHARQAAEARRARSATAGSGSCASMPNAPRVALSLSPARRATISRKA